MAIYEYLCLSCKKGFDVYKKMSEFNREELCPLCDNKSERVLRPPAGIKIINSWNEQANRDQANPYSQAKAQAWNNYHEAKERGEVPQDKPTEAGIQVAAKEIARKK